MLRSILWLLIAPLILLTMSCGGGGNDTKPTVFISASVDDLGDFIEAEMIQDITTDTAIVTVSAGTSFPGNVDTSVGTIRLDRWELSYQRQDGGQPSLPPISGGIDQTVSVVVGSGVGISASFEIEVMRTADKLFSEFAEAFAQDLVPIVFECTLTIIGQNLAGDTVRDTVGFRVQAGIFQPIDDLLPGVISFSQLNDLTLGFDYMATWVAAQASQGLLLSPFGNQFFLDGSFFPVGSLRINTSFLADQIEPGTSQTYPSGVLIVSNTFGSAIGPSLGNVRVTSPAPEPEDPPPPLQILEFFPDRSTITEGESVLLSWSISGDATSLGILPDTYSGVPVDFTGKDLEFDSISIRPGFSVRPLLRAFRELDDATDSQFLSTAITVNPIVEEPPAPPDIVYFTADRTLVAVGRSVIFFWEVTGDVAKVELFPINDQRVDVTGLNTFVSPIIIDDRTYIFSLVVTGTDGSIQKQDLAITGSFFNNLPIVIEGIVLEPGANIDNGDQASFRFTVRDPDLRDSSWEVDKIAGDVASFQPRSGKIPGGVGDVGIAVRDFDDNNNGFLTFEVTAYDDDGFGAGRTSTRAVELVTFETNGQLLDTAPVITAAEFFPSGPEGNPGRSGALQFSFEDPDTLDLEWRVAIISGDFGGTISPSSGTVSTSGGTVSVSYEDDPDTPLDPVVFLIRVTERFEPNPQTTVFVVRVDKSGTDTEDPPPGTPTAPIVFADDGLYDNLFGGVIPGNIISNFTIYSNGSTVTPALFLNSDLSGEITGLSLVVDMQHNSNDPSQITSVTYRRDFAEPSSAVNNAGTLTLSGYFSEPGGTGSPSLDPIVGGIGRWYMPFGIVAFRENDGDPYNLPIPGQVRLYQITLTGTDTSGNAENLVRSLVIRAPSP